MNINLFLSTVNNEDLILTANRRLAVYLQKKYDQLQKEQGKLAWENIQVMPLTTWVEATWNLFSHDTRVQLSDFQELVLWESVMEASSPPTEILLNTQKTAPLVKDTWRLLQYWLLEIDDIPTSSLDTDTFKSWATEFEQKCRELQCISRASVFKTFVEKIRSDQISFPLPSKIYFVGFDEISPIVKKLQQTLRFSTLVEDIQFYNQAAIPQRIAFLDTTEELQHMARWAYQQLQQDPNTTIGCVLPNLTAMRKEVISIFKDVFYAQELHQGSRPPFNISAAESLSGYPIIQIALKIISLTDSEINLEEISCLLRTPFIKGGEKEFHQRALLDAKLRSFGEKKIRFSNLTQSNPLFLTPFFRDGLNGILNVASSQENSATLKNWSELFVNKLAAMGWPGDRSINSTEFQLVERFKKLLSEFETLNKFVGEISFTKALNLLQHLAQTTLFQPKSDDLPIQILGVLEASGIAFDHLWVAGMDDETWPTTPSPNPFIPIALQKKYAMPHSSSARELQFSIAITERFIQNAGEIIFSHHHLDGDRPLRVSPLIEKYAEKELSLLPYSSLEIKIFTNKQLEYFSDELGPPVATTFVAGGSWIFQSQAACPFQAFAKFRLHAKPLDDIQMGLAAHERGSLVHEILAEFWREIKNYERLCALDNDELNRLVAAIIDSVLNKTQARKPFTLKQGLMALEKKRLQKLILNWLVIEKSRQPFEVVSCEQRQTAHIGSLEVHVQIDRVDRLSDGSHLIIDYKTGRPSILDWFSDRPNEPQLPLYTVLSNETIAGVLFGLIRLDELNFRGITAHHDIVPGAITIERIKENNFENIKTLIEYWQINLQHLAEDFCEGKASVSPKEPSTCQYCGLQGLCRVNDDQPKALRDNNDGCG